jgi:TRAP-type C4-dicarboxylate transport system permease small subunit
MIGRALGILRAIEKMAAAGALVVLVTVVFMGVVGRYAGRPVLWSDEVAQGLFVWVALLAGDLTLQRRGHFSVDILANLLPARARYVLDVAIQVLLAALPVLLIYNGFKFAGMTNSRPLPMTGIRASWATAALPVGFTLMLITIVEQVFETFFRRAPPEPETPREVM